MSNKALSLAAVFSWLLLLAGCGSSPTNNYYMLSSRDFPIPSGEAPSLGVGPIEIPEYLSRERIVYNRDGNTLELASLDLWAEPLVDGIQRVMVLSLAGILGTQDVQYFPWHPKRAPAYGIKVNIMQLDTQGQQVFLTAEWLVYRPATSESVQRRISRLQSTLQPGTSQADQVAAAYSDLLYQLTEIIAATITADDKGESAPPKR